MQIQQYNYLLATIIVIMRTVMSIIMIIIIITIAVENKYGGAQNFCIIQS